MKMCSPAAPVSGARRRRFIPENRRAAGDAFASRATLSPIVDLPARVSAFLDERRDDDADASDSLPELVRIRGAMSTLYHGLAVKPGRVPAARALLEELWSEYERLLRRVGEESLARAVRQSADAAPTATVASVSEVPPTSDSRPPASEDDGRAWAGRYRERAPASRVSPSVVLFALLDRVGPPPGEAARAPGAEERALEVDRLEGGTSEEAMRELRLLPNEVQRAYLRLLTARLNAVRASAGADVMMRERIGRSLGIIRDYTREHRPGAVYGLSRDHEPKGGTWEADSHHWWTRLARDEDAPASSRPAVEAASK
jgi:hypothetical protein